MGHAELQRQQQKTTDERIKRRIQFALAAAILTLLVAGSLSYRAIVVSSESERWVQHTHEVLERMQGVLLAAQSMESAYRGFVLTGDETHLSRYPADLARMKRFHANLAVLVADNPAQLKKLPVLQALEDQKIAFAESVIQLRRTKGFEPAAAIIRTGDGERIMVTFRDIIREMRSEETRLLAERTENANRRLNQTKIVLVLSVLLGLSTTLVAFWSIRNESAGRHLAERSLRDSEAKFRGILEAVPDSLIVVNWQREILILNPSVESAFGYAREELLGRNVHQIIPRPPQAEGGETPQVDTQDAVDRSTADLPVGQLIELTGIRKDQTSFPIEVLMSTVDSTQGTLIVATVRDISERKQAEAKLAEIARELRSSNIELQQFAYVASHDLQEPLRMVASYTQLLAKRYQGKLGTEADEFIGFAVDGCNRMKRLIEDLLTFSRAGTQTNRLQRISAEAALKEALANLRTAIHESATVVTYDPLPTLLTDQTVLVQVLQNLIGNAIKYRGPESPRIDIAARKNGRSEWVFSVKDNGLGIDPRFHERIFLLFQRLHGRGEFEGTGIGLAICKKLVERVGGRIWVESQPEQGSTFYFTLPDAQPVQPALAQPSVPLPPNSPNIIDPSAAHPFPA